MKSERAFSFGDNCFDVLRIMSAVLIVIGHTAKCLCINVGIFQYLQVWKGIICLFTISGFLIPSSLERSENNKEYILKRFIRLYPGLWIALFVSLLAVLIVGGGVYDLSFPLGDIFKWLAAQLTVFQFYTPLSIKEYGVGNPNGALWTMSLEIQMYFVIMLVWKWLKKRKDREWIALIVVTAMMNIIYGIFEDALPTLISKLIGVTFIPYVYIFLIGMFAYKNRDIIIPKLAKLFYPLLVAFLGFSILNITVLNFELGHYCNVISAVLIVLLTFSGGYHFGKIKVKHEISYGIYIYHMIVINIMYMIGIREQVVWIFVVVAVSILLGLISELLVEKPCKKKLTTLLIGKIDQSSINKVRK